MLREPQLVDPMSLPLTHQNQLEQVPLRFCASHGTKVVVWPHMPHDVTLTAVPAALAHIMLSTAQGQSQPSLQSRPAAARDPRPVPPASLGKRELSFFKLTFAVCCYLVLSIFNDSTNKQFFYEMLLYDIVCFLFIVPLPPVSDITPLKVDQFAWELQHHPNRQLCNFVLDGLRNGFKLGFQPALSLKSAKKNKPSAYQQPLVIDEYLAHEVSRGRVVGPFRSLPLPNLHISSFGVIPKKGQPGQWRLIVDLSSPGGASVNDGINAHEFTFHYITVDQIIRMVSRLGRGALMAKFDVEAAYRNIPVHPYDRFLLGMKWRESYYVDLTLPFGLRSAPYIFNSVADMVEWILVHSYEVSDLLHYLDDFITAGPPASTQCARNLSTALAVCDQLGLPLHLGKCVGPAPVLTVLGIELDSVN